MMPTRLTKGRAAGLRGLAALALLAAMIAASAAWAAIPSDVLLQNLKPQGQVNVNDFAGILTPAEREKLEARVLELRRKTGAQFAVVIIKSMEGGQIDDFANKLFAKWGVGQKGKNNGLLLLVAMQERKARVEVGYGLEPILPDALAGRVLDEQLFPAFKQRRYAQGLTQAVNRLAGIVERNEPASPQDRRGGGMGAGGLLFLSMFVAGGFIVIGGGLGGRQFAPVLCGSIFGGLALFMAWMTSGLGFCALLLLGLVMLGVGWLGGRRGVLQTLGTGSQTPGWTWNSGGFGGGGGFSGGGGFGGGCSGGGGASGGW